MASTATATHINLTVIRASEVKWNSVRLSKRPNLYVQIEFNDIKRRTNTIKGSLSPKWDEPLSFDLSPGGRGAKCHIQVKHDSSLRDKCVGENDVEVSELLNRCANGNETELPLSLPRGLASAETTAVLHLRLEVVNSRISAGYNIDAAEHAIQQSGISTSADADDSAAVVTGDTAITHFAGHADLYKSVGDIVMKLGVFARAIDALSQVHPYVNFAWQMASALYKSVEHQFEVDKKVVDLVCAMRDAFDFVDQIGILRDKTKRLEATIIQLLTQTDECCLFIREYARRNFARRMFMLGTDAILDKYLSALKELKSSIDSATTTYIAFVSSRISFKVDALFLESRLKPDEMNAFDRPQCLSGTREKIQKEIVEWATLCTAQNVFWLHGVAGSGKSTISTTIAEHFRTISCLGAHLFFRRGTSKPSAVIRTLAYKLASFDHSIAKCVTEAIEQDNDIASASVATQFEKLLTQPLICAGDNMKGPVIIVLDALDECGTNSSRQSLLGLFRDKLPMLPKNFRLLITSRNEMDIDEALSSQSEYVYAVELEHDSAMCKTDVLRYIDHEMRKVFTKNKLKITDDWRLKMERLGDAAGGLFIWASTAINLVDRDYPARWLNDLVFQSQSVSALDSLYRTVLETSGISFDDEASKSYFSQVLGLILLCKIPLTDNEIDGILGYSDEESSRLVLSRLQSVIVYTPGAPIHFCHTSFRDYLLAPGRERDDWFINLEFQKGFVATRCFSTMKNGLRFNICNLGSSYIPNDQIPDLPDRIKMSIPAHLEYACLFWSQHLHEAQFSHALLDELSELLNRRLPYWLEVMSLVERVNIASPALIHAMNWVSSHSADVLAFLRDVRRMITVYLPAISHSTPHIYEHVLPFASMESKFIARYMKRDLPTVQIEQLGVKQRSPLLMKLRGHTGLVRSVAFSLDGTRVVSSSDDKTVRIWDAESGQVLSGPFVGHEDHVQSVVFSPDVSRIVSGSSDKTIRIWDVESGQMTSGPLKGHNGTVHSVSFSPDGMRVVSGSADKVVMVWDVESGQTIKHFKGHVDDVNSVAFSSDGKRIVSGSKDRTIRIWDVESGQAICGPLRGHKGRVWSVAFSRSGSHVASGSTDSTVRIWDAKSGGRISAPFEGHTGPVNSVAFSPDGKYIVSGSGDMTIRIWDVESGQVLSEPFEAHTRWILSVAFSPDGTRVVSGSVDRTIRIWDAERLQTVSGFSEGHVDEVTSVAFSPDARHIASGSWDKRIRIWDAESGKAVSKPFKGHSSYVLSIGFSPDGKRIVSGSGDHTIRVWDAESGIVVYEPFEGHEGDVNSVCFSPDGTRVVSGSSDATVRVWDIEGRRMISGPFKGHVGAIFSVAFSPEGRRIASGSTDNTIRICDVESGEVISGPLKGHTEDVMSVAFSPDGTRIVSGSADKTILIWNVGSGQVVAGPFKGHTEHVTSVAFSPDVAYVVSGSGDGTIRVWDAESGQAIFEPFEGHTGSVWSVAFSPDGRHVASGSSDRMIRMWNIEGPVFNWTLAKSGWIHGREGELLLWIPPDVRSTLLRPRNTMVFGCPFSTRLDFTNAALGERWQECFVPPEY